MDARRASYCCGLVMGLAVGVVTAHVAFSTRILRGRTESSVDLTDESPRATVADSEGVANSGPFPARRQRVVPLGTLPSDLRVASTAAETPQRLDVPADATPLAPRAAEDDRLLKELIRLELAGQGAADRDIWYEALRDLSTADATSVLRLWKANREETSPATMTVDLSTLNAPDDAPTAVPESISELPAADPRSPRDIHLQNLANSGTPGFKRLDPILRSGTDNGGHPELMAVRLDLKSGDLERSERPFDVAIDGHGFFTVRIDGRDAYTRNGCFEIDEARRLVVSISEDRRAVLQPEIVIPAETRTIEIAPSGVVSARCATQSMPIRLGTISLAMFLDPSRIASLGNGLYEPTEQSGAPWIASPGDSAGTLKQSFYERSNVSVDDERQALDRLRPSTRDSDMTAPLQVLPYPAPLANPLRDESVIR